MDHDFALKRRHMVDGQIRTTNVVDHAVLDAFSEVPREAFLPANLKELAYLDEDLPVSDGAGGVRRFLMEPSPLAKLLQLAKIGPGDVVLDAGCATGYSSAVISRIAGSVISVECDAALAEKASNTLTELGYDNVAVVTGPLQDGLASEAPYDVIVVGGAVDQVPQALLDQLKDGGRLVAVLGSGNAAQAHVFTRHGESFASRMAFNCAVRPLPGFSKEPEFQF